MSPLNTEAPLESSTWTLCGVPWSWLSKWIVKAAPAGAVTLGVVNAMPDAVMSTTDPPAAAEPDGAAEPDADGAAEPDPDGAAEPDPDGAALADPEAAALPDGAANSCFQQSG